MKAAYFVVLLQTISSKDITRSSHDSLGSTFANFQGPSFFQLADTGFSSPSSPVYNTPSKNTYQPPKPKPPTHECSQKCSPVSVKGIGVTTQEKCLQITRTVCTQAEEEVTVETCTIKYTPQPVQAEASVVEISYQRECTEMMVTVCQPKVNYGYHDPYSGGKCKELAQETCYNKPTPVNVPEMVTLMAPSPSQECGPMTVTLPTVKCEEVTEEKCVELPALEEAEVSAEQCTVDVDGQDCKQMELTLPVQVCREQLYGDAHKPSKQYHS